MNNQLLSTEVEKHEIIISEDEFAKKISESLLNLGFRPNLKGFIYTKEAICLYTKISFVNSIFKDIYSEVAKKYSVSVMSIDCSIKKSIEAAWYSGKLNTAHKLFKCSYIKDDYPPTNSEFIATMAELTKFRNI